MEENSFCPAMQDFMDTSPKEFVATLGKIFLKANRLKLDEAIAAYQTLDVLINMRIQDLDVEELKIVLALRDKAILGRLIFLTYHHTNSFSAKYKMQDLIQTIESALGIKLPCKKHKVKI